MKRGLIGIALKTLALLLSTVPVAAATLSYFPLWRKEGSLAMISGIVLFLLLLSAVPLIKLIKRYFASPTATTMWFLMFIIFFALSKIADEMVVISLVGYLGNLAASFLWRLSGGVKREG